MIHVYYGEGKGKTTAAVGLAVRAAGAGLRVVFVQFLKGQKSGEIAVLKNLPSVTVLRGKATNKFTFQMDEAERAAVRALHDEHLAEAAAFVTLGRCELLVLDEALGALNAGLLDEGALKRLIAKLPARMELVLTGREPAAFLLAAADYITEMKCLRHPYQQGVQARRGIEF